MAIVQLTMKQPEDSLLVPARLSRKVIRRLVAAALICFSAATLAFSAEAPPIGNYLWFPDEGSAPTEADCAALVAKLKPTDEKVRRWYFGQVPETDFDITSFFLIITGVRIENTFGAEGDYDQGDVTFGPSLEGMTPFTLVPDDHPDEVIKGEIAAEKSSAVVKLTLFDVPIDEKLRDRVTYFCRFASEAVDI